MDNNSLEDFDFENLDDSYDTSMDNNNEDDLDDLNLDDLLLDDDVEIDDIDEYLDENIDLDNDDDIGFFDDESPLDEIDDLLNDDILADNDYIPSEKSTEKVDADKNQSMTNQLAKEFYADEADNDTSIIQDNEDTKINSEIAIYGVNDVSLPNLPSSSHADKIDNEELIQSQIADPIAAKEDLILSDNSMASNYDLNTNDDNETGYFEQQQQPDTSLEPERDINVSSVNNDDTGYFNQQEQQVQPPSQVDNNVTGYFDQQEQQVQPPSQDDVNVTGYFEQQQQQHTRCSIRTRT